MELEVCRHFENQMWGFTTSNDDVLGYMLTLSTKLATYIEGTVMTRIRSDLDEVKNRFRACRCRRT